MRRLSDCPTPPYWPRHGTTRSCHEGDCVRCGLVQEHAESHEGRPCPWVTGDELAAFEADTFEAEVQACDLCDGPHFLCDEHLATAREIGALDAEDAQREVGT